jgi:hypothetical protein
MRASHHQMLLIPVWRKETDLSSGNVNHVSVSPLRHASVFMEISVTPLINGEISGSGHESFVMSSPSPLSATPRNIT